MNSRKNSLSKGLAGLETIRVFGSLPRRSPRHDPTFRFGAGSSRRSPRINPRTTEEPLSSFIPDSNTDSHLQQTKNTRPLTMHSTTRNRKSIRKGKRTSTSNDRDSDSSTSGSHSVSSRRSGASLGTSSALDRNRKRARYSNTRLSDQESLPSESVSKSSRSSRNTNRNGKGKSKRKIKSKCDYEVIYDSPTDALKAPPRRRTRPREKGHTVGDALIFGDCLTWGMSHKYFGKNLKCHWPSYLRERLLATGFRLVESSMISRTTAYDDDEGGDFDFPGANGFDFNGSFHFGTFYNSHTPNWIIIMLGTHDLKKRIRDVARRQKPFALDKVGQSQSDKDTSNSGGSSPSSVEGEEKDFPVTADRIAENCAYLGLKAREYSREAFADGCRDPNIVLVVPPKIRLTDVSKRLGFDEESEKISRDLPAAFERVCRKYNFLRAYRKISMKHSVDGIHLTPKGSKKIAETIWDTMKVKLPRVTKQPQRFEVVH